MSWPRDGGGTDSECHRGEERRQGSADRSWRRRHAVVLPLVLCVERRSVIVDRCRPTDLSTVCVGCGGSPSAGVMPPGAAGAALLDQRRRSRLRVSHDEQGLASKWGVAQLSPQTLPC